MIPAQSHSPESLQDAFQVFNELSLNLTHSYLELEAQAARLAEELTAARSERLKTLTEKEFLANRLQRLLEALPGGVLVTDGTGLIVEHNPAAARFLGAALKGQSWRSALEAVALPVADNPHQRQLRTGHTVSVIVEPLVDEAGQIVLMTDVSEMRNLQEVVNQQKRLSALGEMVASLAHQVRTPLSAALLYTAHLGNNELSDSQRTRFASKLAERLQHIERQVNDMLSFARIGRMHLEKVMIADVLSDLLETFEPTIAGKNLRLTVDNRAAPCALVGNRDALVGILLNLLNNAVEAIGTEAGHIGLGLDHPAPDWLRLVVFDNGPGVPDEIRERIFEPFYTTRAHGTGLGLAVVDCVVRAHGGRVRCPAFTGGGYFELEFPLANELALLPGGFSGQQHHLGETPHGTF